MFSKYKIKLEDAIKLLSFSQFPEPLIISIYKQSEERLVIRSGVTKEACMFTSFNQMSMCTSGWSEQIKFFLRYLASYPDGTADTFIEEIMLDEPRSNKKPIVPLTSTTSDYLIQNHLKYGITLSRLQDQTNAT